MNLMSLSQKCQSLSKMREIKKVEILVDDLVITFVVPSCATIDKVNIKAVIKAFIAIGNASKEVIALMHDILSGKEFGLRIRNIASQPEDADYYAAYVDAELKRITKMMEERKEDYIFGNAINTKSQYAKPLRTIGTPSKGYLKRNNWKRTRSNPKLR